MPTIKRKLPTETKSLKLKKKDEAEDDSITLPTTLSEPETDLSAYSMFLMGEKKIGKTTLLSNFPKALFLMTEPGGKALRIFQMPITRWKQFRKAVVAIEKAKGRYSTVIVDVVDHLFRMSEDFACAKLMIDHPSEAEWGKGYAAVRKEFTTWIQRLMNIPGVGVVFVSHAVEKKIKRGRNGPEYDRVVATLAGQGKDIIEGLVDMWFYYTYDDNRRVLVLEGDEHISAGHRLEEHFKDTRGTALKEIAMGGSAGEAYSAFMAAFNNETLPVKREALESAVDRPIKKKKKRM